MTTNEPTGALTPEQAIAWIEADAASRPDETRDIAERLLRSGAANEDTTFDDIPALLAWDAARRQDQ